MSEAQLSPYDENLLERARTQWQFGDWGCLAALERDQLQQHPDRAKLALLAAAGLLQTGDVGKARTFVRLAQDWGCDKKLISRILIAGVHNSLGRAAAVSVQEQRALEHFETSVATGTPGADVRLLREARTSNQMRQLEGLSVREHLISEQAYTLQAGYDISTIKKLIDECFSADDIAETLERTNSLLNSSELSESLRYGFCCEAAERFLQLKDKMMSCHFINYASEFIYDKDVNAQYKFRKLGQLALDSGHDELSVDFMLKSQAADSKLSGNEKERVLKAYEKIREERKKKQQHGHELLINYLECNSERIDNKKTLIHLIEIGTTREIVPGQGSTKLIAEFCKKKGIKFTTVDIDPNNTLLAKSLFSKMAVPFNAVTMKGEDFLDALEGEFDYIFLDAYDFDHGSHSELRQSRYEKYLGERIIEENCHKMHLACAKSIVTKLSNDGIVCIDDTWLDEQGKWTAKGTLAMPYLLENGFCLIEARNRAALLKRDSSVTQ